MGVRSFAMALVAQASVFVGPATDGGVIGHLGEVAIDPDSGTASVDFEIDFSGQTTQWRQDHRLSFVGINLAASGVEGLPVSDFSTFRFDRDPTFAAWWVENEFGDAVAPALFEMAPPPVVIGGGADGSIALQPRMRIGELVFDYVRAGLGGGDRFTVDLTGGEPMLDRTAIFLDAIGGEVEAWDVAFLPGGGQRSVRLGGSNGGHGSNGGQVPEPATVVIGILTILIGGGLRLLGRGAARPARDVAA